MKLNYQLNVSFKKASPVLVFVHGLFGDLNNFNTLAKKFIKKNYNTLQIDLRNHGKSPHDALMTYQAMAQDILELLDNLFIEKYVVIGHSMGGKIAMTLPMLAKDRIIQMVVIDIAPVTYKKKHQNIFSAIQRVNMLRLKNRREAFTVMNKFITDQNIVFFLLKSFKEGIWSFNFENIQKNYFILNEWQAYPSWSGNALFICGSCSSYVKQEYYDNIYQQFPKALICIMHSGHWVHTEKCYDTFKIIDYFLNNKNYE